MHVAITSGNSNFAIDRATENANKLRRRVDFHGVSRRDAASGSVDREARNRARMTHEGRILMDQYAHVGFQRVQRVQQASHGSKDEWVPRSAGRINSVSFGRVVTSLSLSLSPPLLSLLSPLLSFFSLRFLSRFLPAARARANRADAAYIQTDTRTGPRLSISLYLTRRGIGRGLRSAGPIKPPTANNILAR